MAFGPEAGAKKLVIFGVEGGRKGWMPLMFQEKIRRGTATADFEGSQKIFGGDGGEATAGVWTGDGWEIRRRLQGGGLIFGEDIGMVDSGQKC